MNIIEDPTTVAGLISSILGMAMVTGLIWLYRVLKGRLDRVVSQTENSHAGGDYPNLRNELTATRVAAESSTKALEQIREEVEGVRDDVRILAKRQDSLSDRMNNVSDKLDRHIADPCADPNPLN